MKAVAGTVDAVCWDTLRCVMGADGIGCCRLAGAGIDVGLGMGAEDLSEGKIAPSRWLLSQPEPTRTVG